MLGARPSDGSSSSSICGSAMRARAMASICCSPPDKEPASCPLRSASFGNSAYMRSQFCVVLRRNVRLAPAPMRRFSSTLSCPNTRRPSGTSVMPRRTMAAVSALSMSVPARRTLPPLRGAMPMMDLRIELLPAPLAPSKATISPLATERAYASYGLNGAVRDAKIVDFEHAEAIGRAARLPPRGLLRQQAPWHRP